MAFTDCSTHSLGRLLASAIFNGDILVRSRPSLLLVTTSFEDALVSENKMATILSDLINTVSQLNGHVSILLVKLFLLLRLILCLDFLVLETIEFENFAEILWLNNTVRELTMEKLGSFRKT